MVVCGKNQIIKVNTHLVEIDSCEVPGHRIRPIIAPIFKVSSGLLQVRWLLILERSETIPLVLKIC